MNIYSMIEKWFFSMFYLFLGMSNNGELADAGGTTTRCGNVFITVSALKNSHIELNWENQCGKDDLTPARIALYNKDIRTANEKDVIMYDSVVAALYPKGMYRTNITFNKETWPENWKYKSNTLQDEEGQNFPYWIVSFSNDDRIIDIQSLKLQPTWMNDNREKLKRHQIGDLVIPGTHDSGCYSGVLLFQNYILTQDFSIWDQLVFGNRYLDLRIAFQHDGEFYINHDLIRVKKLEIVYRQIKEFITRSPSEIIVLDFHRFPYPTQWSHELHEKFIKYTLDYFGDYVLPKNNNDGPKGPTLEQIWNSKKNIILAYGEKGYAETHPQLWNPVQQAWANTINVSTLKQYLQNFMDSGSYKTTMFNALMAELTPRPIDIITSKNNLRQLANDVNPSLTKWVRDEWYGKVNIIATDYFLGNNLIEVAIDVNRNR
ncbi:hypothetical protein WA026_005393 [Henosepilachna vigintioctopunctata]|uniref:Uncharacterized protein n=1 Tax=Henosepilachna vigintioctopunctata TaxID=420089 RepID=A0AAW1U0T5_9CUCU